MEWHGRKKAWINCTLIILNVVYFLYLEIAGSSEDTLFMLHHGAMFTPLVVEEGEYYRLLTSVFMHFGIHHITNNMIILFILGDNMERALGSVKYLIFIYFAGLVLILYRCLQACKVRYRQWEPERQEQFSE